MRTRFAFLAILIALAGAPVAADETPPTIAPSDPGAGPVPVEKTRQQKLDELFATLKSVTTDESARSAESEILHIWLASGSDTVDLLMAWALRALDQKNYPLSLDFLDRVVTMRPDYAEGWNKRATVYFLLSDYSKSIADIGHTLALEPRHFGALSGLGMIFRQIGDDRHAMEAYKRALEVDPHLDNVQKALDEMEAKDSGSPI